MDKNNITIIGLGNGDSFENTLHNIGRDMVIRLSEKYSKSDWINNGVAKHRSGVIGDTEVLFVISDGFMNNTGDDLYDYIKENEFLVIHDEIDIPFERTKFSHDRGAAGHNGVRSIIEKLGHKNFMRIRVGIGGKEGNIYDLVYRKIDDNTKQKFGEIFKTKIAPSIECLVQNGVGKAEQMCNTKA